MKSTILVLLILILDICESKLYQTFVFFRHGARYHTNSLYDGNSTYSVRGQLTAIGMRMHQNLGKIIRSQYIQKNALLNTKYNSSQIQIYSTRYDRTVQSAQSFIYGVYPSEIGPRLPYVDRPYHLPPYATNKTDIDEQNYALPNAHQIITVKFDDKVILKDCLNWQQLVNKSITTRKLEYEQMTLTYTPFLKKLTSLFYKNQSTTISIDQAVDVFDTLYVDKYLGRSLPQNINEQDYKNLQHLNSWYYTFTCAGNLSHLINTNKFNKVINQFQNRIRLINNYATKMTIISAHDTDIASLLTDLNITSSVCIEQLYRKGSTQALNCQTNVGFASNLIIQLHSDDGIGFYVKIRNDGKYVKLCEKQQTKCDYIEWRNRIKYILVNNVQNLCKH